MAKTINLHGHNYVVINRNTQKAESIYDAFRRSSDVTLYDVYGRYSQAKADAYEYCRKREQEFNSCNGVITSYNIFQFTYAFIGLCNGKHYLVYITKSADYAIELEA